MRYQHNLYTTKSTFSGLQFCRRHYGPIFIYLAVVVSQSREIMRNSDKIWPYSSSRSSKVIDLGVNGKTICDFLLVINCNYSRIEIFTLKYRKLLILTTPPLFEAPARGNPLECLDEIWHQKTGIVGLPDGVENIMPAFFVLTHTSSWQRDGQRDEQRDGQTDRHVTIARLLPALA